MRSYSIIIPFKTGKHFLKACIESVLMQSYQYYEIIVLTDNTSNEDGSIDYLKELNHPKINIITSNYTLNILENWERIKDVNKAEFMTILGYDDVLYPQFLEEINLLIESHPTASLYHTHFNYINKIGEIIHHCKPMPELLSSGDYLSMALQEQLSIMATGYVFKSSDYIKLGGIDTTYPNLIYADLQLWIDLASIGNMVTSPKTLFGFRLHASTTKISKDKVLMEALLMFISYLGILSNKSSEYKEVINKYTSQFLEQTTKSIAHRLLRTPAINRKGLTINEMVEKIRKSANELRVPYQPENIISFRLALFIEKSKILSEFFILLKSIYKKPFY